MSVSLSLPPHYPFGLRMNSPLGSVDTAAESNPTVDFDTSSATWKNMARVAVLCSRAEFNSDGSEGMYVP